MDQHPVSWRNSCRGDESDAHATLHTGNIHFCDLECFIDDLYDLTWDTKTHSRSPMLFAAGPLPLLPGPDLTRHRWGVAADGWRHEMPSRPGGPSVAQARAGSGIRHR